MAYETGGGVGGLVGRAFGEAVMSVPALLDPVKVELPDPDPDPDPDALELVFALLSLIERGTAILKNDFEQQVIEPTNRGNRTVVRNKKGVTNQFQQKTTTYAVIIIKRRTRHTKVIRPTRDRGFSSRIALSVL